MEDSRPDSESVHPCVRCGACCATYFVLFDRAETSKDSEFQVPLELTEKVDSNSRAMLGTNQPRPRCVALQGRLGHEVGCTIYAQRPSCCRNFQPSYESGVRNPRCDLARKGKGLRVLQANDWENFRKRKADYVDMDKGL